jgi:hypothetical protein
MPVHTSVNVESAMSGRISSAPAAARAPLQPPEAEQLVAFVEDHVSTDVPVAFTTVGVAFNVNVGGGTAVTVID